MEATTNSTADLLSDPLLWQNESFLLNTTAANTSVVYKPIIPPGLNKAINIILITTLSITMLSLGCIMEISKIKHHILKPKGVGIAVMAQYLVMPLTGFCLAKAFNLSDISAVVVLICGCSPGGNLSNILTLALQGDLNLSIVMTSCSTILALGMMPLLLYLYCQGFADLHKMVPYLEIILSLFGVLLPCGVGILINHYRPRYAQIIKKVGPRIWAIAIVVILVLANIGVERSILTVIAPSLMATGALMPLIGYTFGYAISSLFKLEKAERRTVAMETGCQNIQLCTTIVKMAFPLSEIGPLFLFPMILWLFQLIEGSVVIVLFRCHRRLALKKRETYQLADTAETQGAPPPETRVDRSEAEAKVAQTTSR